MARLYIYALLHIYALNTYTTRSTVYSVASYWSRCTHVYGVNAPISVLKKPLYTYNYVALLYLSIIAKWIVLVQPRDLSTNNWTSMKTILRVGCLLVP